MLLGKKLAVNTALLTVASLVMRCLGLFYQVWLAGRIGAAGIGLFQLVLSVGMLFATVAVSGIRFAATRLISEELGQGRAGSVGAAVHRCLGYALLFGCAAGAALWLCAEPIGFLWIGDARTVRPLRLFALSLPALGLTSVLAGYFTAVGRVWKTAGEQLGEQLGHIALTALLLARLPGGDLEQSCAAVMAAGVLSDNAGLAAMLALYLLDRRRHRAGGEIGARLTPRLLGIALPLAASAYARSALNAFRQLLVPRGLKRSGLSADAALAGYGIIGGMALPVLLFPTAVLTALAELLVPALTEAQVAGRTADIRRAVKPLLRAAFLFSLVCGSACFLAADVLAGAVCRDARAAPYIRLLAPMLPFLYTDIVTDGCLKGLGQMMHSMVYNIAEAALGLTLVWALLPRWALAGYVFVLYVCEIFNFALSLRRLRKVTRPGRAERHRSSAAVHSPQSSSSRNRISYSPSAPVTSFTSLSSKPPAVSAQAVTDWRHSGG